MYKSPFVSVPRNTLIRQKAYLAKPSFDQKYAGGCKNEISFRAELLRQCCVIPTHARFAEMAGMAAAVMASFCKGGGWRGANPLIYCSIRYLSTQPRTRWFETACLGGA